jgi:hypothetical protein
VRHLCLSEESDLGLGHPEILFKNLKNDYFLIIKAHCIDKLLAVGFSDYVPIFLIDYLS